MEESLKKFLLYTAPTGEIRVDVLLQDESVWLTQKAIAELFGVVKSTVSEHLTNIFTTNELDETSTVRKIRTVLDKMKEKATLEYKKYKAKTLSSVETEYLKTISLLEQQAKKGDRLSKVKGTKKGGKA